MSARYSVVIVKMCNALMITFNIYIRMHICTSRHISTCVLHMPRSGQRSIIRQVRAGKLRSLMFNVYFLKNSNESSYWKLTKSLSYKGPITIASVHQELIRDWNATIQDTYMHIIVCLTHMCMYVCMSVCSS